MIRDERGSMTAFLAMLFLAFLLMISICVEGIYLYIGKGKAMGACMAGLSHTHGNYQKELEEMYHIFAMDPRYQKKVSEDFSKKVKESLEGSSDTFDFQIGNASIKQKVFLTDQDGEVLKYQIRELMKYEMGADVMELWKKKWSQTKEAENEIPKIQEKINQDERDAKEKEEDENTKNTYEKEEDPRKGLTKMLREGSISLIMGERKVSSLAVISPYGMKDHSKQKTWGFMKKKDAQKQLDEVKNVSSGTGLQEELPSILYSLKYFHCLTSKEKKEGLQYETEYLIAGKDSEKENLGTVFWKMISLRFLTNIAYVYTDTKKETEAAALAASVLGITGIPPLIAAAKHLLLMALAYGESVIDVRNLADGKQVPVMKNVSNWQLSFSGLATLTCSKKPVKKGLSYEDYLGILLIMQKEKKEKYGRMMDIIEGNIRRKVPDFRLDQCISSYAITQSITLKRLSFGGLSLPFPSRTQWNFQRTASY